MHKLAVPAVLIALSLACGGDAPPGEPATPPPAAEKETKVDGDAAAKGHDMAGHDMNHDADAATTPPLQPITHADAKVAFLAPTANAKVASPVHVVFGVEGLEVKPAGEVVPNTGHHHLVIDGEPVPAGEAVPADATHIHYGKGQVETDVELTPGEHTLTMQFADGLHRSYGPDYSATITVTVLPPPAE